MLDDGGVDQPTLHLPQVRGDNVDVQLGELKDEHETEIKIMRPRPQGLRKVARKARKKMRSRRMAVLSSPV